jgi:hypothetical protein
MIPRLLPLLDLPPRKIDRVDPGFSFSRGVGLDVVGSGLGDDGESGGMLLEEDESDGVNVMEVDKSKELVLLE